MHILKSQTLSDDELLKSAMSHGPLLEWNFGPIMDMHFDPKALNYLFSEEKVPFHWDGAFFKEPLKLLFYCIESEGKGGETLFVDTEKIWDSLSANEKEMCSKITLVYKTSKIAHYGGEINVPLVQSHPITGKTILRMAEKVETNLNPVELTIQGTKDQRAFYDFMVDKLYDERFVIEHVWQKGDLLIVDNFTYLHGRKPLVSNKSRRFKRIQILKKEI